MIFCLDSFTWHTVFRFIYVVVCISTFHSSLWPNTILYEYLFYLSIHQVMTLYFVATMNNAVNIVLKCFPVVSHVARVENQM